MKTQIESLRKQVIKAVLLLLASVMVIPASNAQIVLPNVRVNMNDYDRVSFDGGAKPIAAVNDTVYAVWQGEPTTTTSNIYFSKSIDGGTSFLEETLVYDGSPSIRHMFPSLHVGQNGDIYVTWTAVTNNETTWNVWFSKSTDGGATFQTPVHVTNGSSFVYSCIGAYGNNVYVFYADATNYPMADYFFARSTNNGDLFESPIQVNDATNTSSIEFDAVNTLTVDQSGNIYLAWVDGRRVNGNGDIFFARSTDNGQSFGANVMVNDMSQLGADSIQHNPSITVDNSNNVFVSFTDKRLGSDFGDSRIYMASSSDGGSSFATESLLAGHDGACKSHDISANASGKLSAALCAHIAPNWGTWLFESTDGGSSFSTPVALSDVFDADYSDIRVVLKPNNELCAVWKDDRTGSQNVYFTRTDLAINVSDPTMESEYVLYPNPTSGSVFLKIPAGSKSVEVIVRNPQGQLVYSRSFTDTSNMHLDMELSTGMYFVTISSTTETSTVKLIWK